MKRGRKIGFWVVLTEVLEVLAILKGGGAQKVSTLLIVLSGSCPTDGGSCPIGLIVLGVDVLDWKRCSCPWGVIFIQCSSPWGSCPNVIVPGLVVFGVVVLEPKSMYWMMKTKSKHYALSIPPSSCQIPHHTSGHFGWLKHIAHI